MYKRTLAVIPFREAIGPWERTFPDYHVVREGSSVFYKAYDRVLFHEDVELNHTWIHIFVMELSAKSGARFYQFKAAQPDNWKRI